MAMESVELDRWRNYFRTTDSDIFDIIENAIAVAASDCPKEFSLRRDQIAEKLFTCNLTRCSGCALAGPAGDGGKEEDEVLEVAFGRDSCKAEAGDSKESKAGSTRFDNTVGNTIHASNYSFGEAEALTDEIEEETQSLGEVFRIKEILQNCEYESDSTLFDSLRLLQLMVLTVDILQATEIGKAVNGLRKHNSKDIRHLARTLIEDWKIMVDEWVSATAATAAAAVTTEGTPDSVNPSVLDEEEGLPSPPLEDGIFFTTQPTSMELSQFFDGMDDDENINNREMGRKPSVEKQTILRPKPKPKPQLHSGEVNELAKDNQGQQLRSQEAVAKPKKPLDTEAGPRRHEKSGLEEKAATHEAKGKQMQELATVQKRPPAGRPDTDADRMKFEATKRKLHERYQQAEHAKKQRTIQVMELHDLPKKGHGFKNPPMKPGNHGRPWLNGRR